MYPLTYLRPASVAEASAFLLAHGDAKPLTGGMTLIPTLKQRLAAPSHLLDLSRLEELHSIGFEGGVLRIGAATTHREVAESPIVAAAIPALAVLAGQIADPQVRNRGTMGGSLANNDPAADYPSGLLGLDGTVVTQHRRIAADEFFDGMFQTVLEPGELIVAIEYPQPVRASYVKYRHPSSGFAIVGVFIAETPTEVRVAVTGAGPCVFRWAEAEAALGMRLSADSLDGLMPDLQTLLGDMHASQERRAHLVGVIARRSLAALLG
jgi:carbon-monoxide dehydrogenase medium subunit